MQNTSALYKEIFSGAREFETKIYVAGHEIGYWEGIAFTLIEV